MKITAEHPPWQFICFLKFINSLIYGPWRKECQAGKGLFEIFPCQVWIELEMFALNF